MRDAAGKTCSRCGAYKTWDGFYNVRSAKDGKQSHCKSCDRLVRQEYRERNASLIKLREAERMLEASTEGVKPCTKCGVEKSLKQFYQHPNTRDKRQPVCRECQRATTRAWNARNAEQIKKRNGEYYAANRGEARERSRRWWLRLYGITEEDYTALLESQNGTCAICLLPERYVDARTGKVRRLAVDHDHESGEVRGLLCGRCNRSIGQFADDHERLHRAAEYLRKAAMP